MGFGVRGFRGRVEGSKVHCFRVLSELVSLIISRLSVQYCAIGTP